jgi:hypothetical protein
MSGQVLHDYKMPVANKDELESRRRRFEDLLNGMTTLDDKKKYLWLDIYNNAFRDIERAYRLFDEAVSCESMGTQMSHVEVGPILVKYIERASKANDQLIKLVAMLEDAEKEEEEANFEDLRSARDQMKSII